MFSRKLEGVFRQLGAVGVQPGYAQEAGENLGGGGHGQGTMLSLHSTC